MLTASSFWHWRLTAWGHGHWEHHRSHLKAALERKKKQCNQREEDTSQDREKHSCCPVHHTPNCFNRICAACCLYVVCPHRHNGMNNFCGVAHVIIKFRVQWTWNLALACFCLAFNFTMRVGQHFQKLPSPKSSSKKKWNETHWKQVLWITLLLAMIWHTFKSVSWWTPNFVLKPGKWS